MKKKIFNYIYLIPVIILAATLPYKFTGNALPYLYKFLGNDLVTLIGVQELILVILLLISKTRVYGALGAVATMVGAIITHVLLGEYDIVFAQAIITLIASLIVTIQHGDSLLDALANPFGYTHVRGYYRKKK